MYTTCLSHTIGHLGKGGGGGVGGEEPPTGYDDEQIDDTWRLCLDEGVDVDLSASGDFIRTRSSKILNW